MISENIAKAIEAYGEAEREYREPHHTPLNECRGAMETARSALVAAIDALQAEKERAVAALVSTVEVDIHAQLYIARHLYVSPTGYGAYEVFGRGPRAEYATAREAVEAALKEAK